MRSRVALRFHRAPAGNWEAPRRRINRRSQRLTETYLDWRREMLEAERLELQEMRDEGDLPDPVMRDLLREIDVREAALGPSD